VQHTVVGISPERFFAQLGSPPQLWLPSPVSAEDRQDRRGTVPTLARLAEGVTFEQVNAELERLSLNIAEQHPETDQGLAAKAVPLKDVLVHYRQLAFGLVLAATLVLAAAGAVAANLFLVQAAERSREQAIRQAVGASMGALVGQWCLQVAVLMLLAVGLGTLLGHWAIDGILASQPSGLKMSSFGTIEASVTWRSWLGTVAVAAAATPLIGLVPARQAATTAIGRMLRDGGGGAVGKARGRRTRRLLIGLQLALASALTVGAACAYLVFVVARESPLGFEAEGVIQLRLPDLGADPVQRAQLFSRLERDAGGAGSSLQLAAASDPLLTRWYQRLSFYVEGTPRPAPAALPWAKRNDVSQRYFQLLGIPLLAGRAFVAGDDLNAPCVAILSEKLALKTFAGGPSGALGRRLHVDAVRSAGAADAEGVRAVGTDQTITTCEVVGVAGEVHDTLPGSPGDIYLPTAQWPPGGETLYARGSSAQDLARLKALIRSLDPRQVIQEQPLSESVAASSWAWRLLAGMFLALAFVGSSLAGAGTYAVLAHSASVRRREFGLRAVLGARPRELAWLAVAENLKAGAVGIVVGLVLVAAGMMAVARYQPQPSVYPIAAVLMACVLTGSALLAARRVLKLEPGLALRRR
jgi:predicted permease